MLFLLYKLPQRQGAIALIHLQGLKIIHDLAMDHGVVLVGAQLSEIPPPVHIEGKLLEELQKHVFVELAAIERVLKRI